LLVLVSRRGQVLAAAETAFLAAAALAVAAMSAATPVAALARRQLSTVGAFEQRPLSGEHTLPAEVSADQVQHLNSIMVVIACLPCGRVHLLARWVGPQAQMSEDPLRLLGDQTASAQLQRGAVLQVRGFRPRQIVSQIA